MDQPPRADGSNPTAQAEQPTRFIIRHPVVLVLGKEPTRKRKKKKYSSRGSRRLTEIDRRVSKASRRLSRAIDHGIDTYIEHRDKSREERRDGAVVDFIENASYGVSKGLSEASPVIHDVGEALNTRRARRQIRRFARGFARLPLIG